MLPACFCVYSIVMARLVRAIHVFFFLTAAKQKKNVDGPHSRAMTD